MRYDLAAMRRELVAVVGAEGVSVYTGPLHRAHVALSIPKRAPERGSHVLRFYNPWQLRRFINANREGKSHESIAA